MWVLKLVQVAEVAAETEHALGRLEDLQHAVSALVRLEYDGAAEGRLLVEQLGARWTFPCSTAIWKRSESIVPRSLSLARDQSRHHIEQNVEPPAPAEAHNRRVNGCARIDDLFGPAASGTLLPSSEIHGLLWTFSAWSQRRLRSRAATGAQPVRGARSVGPRNRPRTRAGRHTLTVARPGRVPAGVAEVPGRLTRVPFAKRSFV